jgi:hypothetical protein
VSARRTTDGRSPCGHRVENAFKPFSMACPTGVSSTPALTEYSTTSLPTIEFTAMPMYCLNVAPSRAPGVPTGTNVDRPPPVTHATTLAAMAVSGVTEAGLQAPLLHRVGLHLDPAALAAAAGNARRAAVDVTLVRCDSARPPAAAGSADVILASLPWGGIQVRAAGLDTPAGCTPAGRRACGSRPGRDDHPDHRRRAIRPRRPPRAWIARAAKEGQAWQSRNVTLTPARIVHIPATSPVNGCSTTPNTPAQSVQVRVVPTRVRLSRGRGLRSGRASGGGRGDARAA